jgi:hypothetical protein
VIVYRSGARHAYTQGACRTNRVQELARAAIVHLGDVLTTEAHMSMRTLVAAVSLALLATACGGGGDDQSQAMCDRISSCGYMPSGTSYSQCVEAHQHISYTNTDAAKQCLSLSSCTAFRDCYARL